MHQGLKKIEINSLVPNLDRYILDYPGDHYLDRDQFVDEEEESDTPGYLEGPPRRVATLANLNFYKPLAEKALTYYNSKECTNLLLKEVLVADRQHQPETVVWMNFIARSEDDSKLFYFFANLQDGPYPNYHDVKEMCFEEDFKEPQPSDFQVKELCSLETHDSDYSQSIASRAWGYKVPVTPLVRAAVLPSITWPRPQEKLKSIPCLDYPGDYYIDRDQIAQICC
ncbi:uncharacterized protein LOC130805307 isoform X9 [Amaranthus tricolor]|uniref:uncharacterized protein LOC130805307 isoform X9 n=1 Tax=Amaranthus tricolor TaxID=29722 RepID=UPI00258942D7|nr:uncharacterized protein LOC130805307 isoform X9 [Amaranthus tricolor]